MTEGTTSNKEVTIYEHGNYQGRSQKLGPGKYNIGDLAIGNDRLSSLKIPEGIRVTLYEHANFMGNEKKFDADAPWVGDDFNDKTSSIMIELETTTEGTTNNREVTIYEHGNYQGRSQKLSPGKYNIGDLSIGGDTLSSLKVPDSIRVTLYEHPDFRGNEKRFDMDASWVGDDFNDKTSSILVELVATIYEHGNYQGRSQKLSPGMYNIGDLSIGNDCLSSLKVPEGLRVTFYEHANFSGRTKTFLENSTYVGNDFNDITSSITVDVVGPNYAKWMEYNFDKIKYKKLKELCFPGTHNSGTYDLKKELAPDADDIICKCWEYGVLGGATGLDDYIRGQSICQDKTVYEQLLSGIRYIDLRVCWQNNDFYTCHALLGNPTRVLLNDIKRFLDENKQEIVIVKPGFKKMDDRINAAKELFKSCLGGDEGYYVEDSLDKSGESNKSGESIIFNRTFKDQVEKGKRAIFLTKDFTTNYKEEATTNSQVLEELIKLSSKTGILEAQFNRPIKMSTDSLSDYLENKYVLGYVQKYGCRLLPVLPLISNMPIIGPVLGGLGAVAIPGFILYLRNCSPVPTDLKENAWDSYSIIKNYFSELAKGPSMQRPTLTICDFFEEVPLVDIAIRVSTDQLFADLLGCIHDISPEAFSNRFLSDCPASAIAAAFKAAGYCASEAAKFMKDNIPGITGEVLAVALKGAGYGLNEVGNALKDVGYGVDAIASALRKAGYNANEAAKFVKDSIPGVPGEVLAATLKGAGYGLNEVGTALKEMGYGIDAIASALRSAGYNANEAAKFMKDFIPGVTSEVLAVALKNAGYGLNEVGNVLKDLYGFGPEALKKVLEGAGYAGEEIGNFFKSLGGEFADFAKSFIDFFNPSRW